MSAVKSLLAVLSGYLLGSAPSADAAGRLAGVSLRAQGSGNPGALNATALLGRRWGAAVAALDVGKGVAAAAVGRRVSPGTAHAAATAAVVGHVFPVWSGFRGGKGVATSYGGVLIAFPAYAVPDLLVAGAAARVTRKASRANDVACVVWTASALLWWWRKWPNLWGPPPTAALPLSAAATSALIAWRFRQPDRVSGGARFGSETV